MEKKRRRETPLAIRPITTRRLAPGLGRAGRRGASAPLNIRRLEGDGQTLLATGAPRRASWPASGTTCRRDPPFHRRDSLLAPGSRAVARRGSRRPVRTLPGVPLFFAVVRSDRRN